MSWSSWAKTLAKEAQRGIDIVLDINEDPNAAGQPDRTSTEIGSTENTDTLLPTAYEENNEPVSRKENNHNSKNWNEQWSEETAQKPRRSPPKKTSPRSSRIKAKRISKIEKTSSPNEDEKKVNGMNPVSPTHDEDPGGGDAAAVETISEKLSLKVAADLGDPRCSAETSNDQQENSAIESQRQIDFLQEHTEAMGNSFHALTKQLSFREQQLVGISTNNAELQAENDELRGKVTYLEEYSSDVENFSRKIELLEDEVHKRQLQLKAAKDQIASSFSKNHVDDIVKEKDDQIQGLMSEGEKLSKEQLTLNNTIKKLRTRVKETDEKLKKTDERAKKSEESTTRLEGELETVKEEESKKSEALRRLTYESEKAHDEIQSLRANLEDNQEKIRSLEVTLDSAYKEIAELQRTIIEKDHNKEGAMKLEEAKFTLQKQFDESARQWELERHQLRQRIQSLQDESLRVESDFSRREDNLKRQLTNYQSQLEESEQRNHNLGQSIQSATRPLLRQIENLQTTNSSQTANFEALEKTFQTRIEELQEQIALHHESDRTIRDTIRELRAQIKILERSRAEANDLQAKLQQQLDEKIKSLQDAEAEKEVLISEYQAEREQLNNQVEQLRREIVILEGSLEKERAIGESEKAKRVQQESETQALQRLWNYPSQQQDSLNLPNDRESITSDGDISFSGVSENILDSSFSVKSTPLGPGIIETLQSQLKQREGELYQLRSDRSEAQSQREKLAHEVVRLSEVADRIEEYKSLTSAQKKKITELEKRYSALLTLYGEKVETVEELQYDLADVKQLLRAQTEEWALLMAGSSNQTIPVSSDAPQPPPPNSSH